MQPHRIPLKRTFKRRGEPVEMVFLQTVFFFFGQDEVGLAYFFINKENPPPDRRRSLEQALKRMGQFARTLRCRHRQISEHLVSRLKEGIVERLAMCAGETEVIQSNEAAIVARAATGLVAELGGALVEDISLSLCGIEGRAAF